MIDSVVVARTRKPLASNGTDPNSERMVEAQMEDPAERFTVNDYLIADAQVAHP